MYFRPFSIYSPTCGIFQTRNKGKMTSPHPRPIERYHATRHFLGFDSCVVASAKYASRNGTGFSKDILFAALHQVINEHPALGVKLQNESTSNARFTRLENIDLSRIVEFSDHDNLQMALESQLARNFDTDADFPLWRIQVLNDNSVLLAIHHVIGDGLSTVAFHTSLLQALRNFTPGGSQFIQIPDSAVLLPPVDAVTSLRPSPSTILTEMHKLHASKSWTSASSAWSGNPVPRAASVRTNVRLMSFPPPDITVFCALCRKHRATVTSALYVLTVSIISRMIEPDPARYKTIASGVAISLREASGISNTVICDFASAHYTYPAADPIFSWAAAARYAVALQKQKRTAREKVGMLRFLFGKFVPYMQGHLDTKRGCGFVLSNLGRFDAPTAEDSWNIAQVLFAQCDVVIGAAFKLSVVCDPSGVLNIVFTWGDQSIGRDFVESFMSQFQGAFRDLLA
ncbi:alcohol acetyltransferase [Mycena rosella]|uniref:Alcohol acetyltransferase n=1 Tax=Mycena rosella TaxID=1033263 RepID=A0AAD7GK82_MYCRO|nr:alcohol acetyltransferase [Mycena rosella]